MSLKKQNNKKLYTCKNHLKPISIYIMRTKLKMKKLNAMVPMFKMYSFFKVIEHYIIELKIVCLCEWGKCRADVWFICTLKSATIKDILMTILMAKSNLFMMVNITNAGIQT